MDQPSSETPNAPRAWLRLWTSRHLDVVAGAFWLSVTSYLISSAWDFGVLDVFIGLAGTASCGFSWLLARALFRPDAERETWPLLIVAGLMVTGVLLDLFSGARGAPGLAGYVLGASYSVHSMLSSAVLLLCLVEACLGYRSDLPQREKRFRIGFVAGYASLVGVAVLWVDGAPEGSWAEQASAQIKMLCAMLTIGLSIWAWWFRRQHPLPRPKRRQRRTIDASPEDQALADRILEQLERDKLYLEPDLKLADFSRRVGETSHRVSASISGVLGFPNFNALINQFRINAAKQELQSSELREKSILAIALDVGFSSIGPFNRAFKRETGTTPSDFRRKHALSEADQTRTFGASEAAG